MPDDRAAWPPHHDFDERGAHSAGTPDGPHWHAYAWTGNTLPPEADRRRLDMPLPPLTISHWLHKPDSLHRGTYPLLAGRGDAYAWLLTELEQHPRAASYGPPDTLLAHTRDCLTRETDVIWDYWARDSRYVTRNLIVCPRPDVPACPHRAVRA